MDERSIPTQLGPLMLDCHGQHPKIWAQMGPQDGLPKRLLDRGARDGKYQSQSPCLLGLGEQSEKRRLQMSSFLLINIFQNVYNGKHRPAAASAIQ